VPRDGNLRTRSWIAGLLLVGALSFWAEPAACLESPADPLNRTLVAAERSLREGRLQDAEKHYRAALTEGWLLLGIIERSEERLPEAREAFRRASVSTASENRRALQLLAPAVEKLARAERADLRQRVREALARSYLNLGVMQTRGERFGEAAELFEQAAAIDPDFPQLRRSLGVARFNAKQFDKATEPLSRALAADPTDAGLRRMLAMASLETEAYERAAELLEEDTGRASDPSLQFAYGVSLVRSGRAREAETVFRGLLSQHGDWPELNVVLGQAHAQEGDFESAIRSLQRSLELKPDVAEANGTLGVIYLKQGRLAEAESALRAELKTQPQDLKSQQNLAVVLDLQQRGAEALPFLRRIVESKPDVADSRYLLGKILLSQGEVAEAVEQLEAAARLAPQDANVRYQLGKAYQGQGRTELAQQEFETFRQLKAKR